MNHSKMQLPSLILLNLAISSANPKVSTPLGDILGSTLTSRLNRTIYAFRGVRYAQPPIGDLRFKPPAPIGKWAGTYNATTDGPVCPQRTTRDPVSEDCLFINIYTTKFPDDGHAPKRPVIVYLHAGGFYSGSGRSNWEGPQYFMDHNIVLVTLNYRLGSLGFISIGEEAPGNNGLKDQVVALKWVRDNIASFGGDPDNVTLFGYSAGAFSITLHLVSPLSRGLFHKAILGSGSILGQWTLENNQLDLARKQASFVGCPGNVSPKALLQCLKAVPAEDLGNSLPRFKVFGNDPVIVWYPVIEEDFGQERFLAEDPLGMFERGDFAQVPVVIGVTEKEFGYRAFSLVSDTVRLSQLSTDFETYGSIAFMFDRGTVSSSLREFYLGDAPLNNASFIGLSKLYADSIIGFAVNRAANVISEKSSAPVYYYEFTYQGRFSHFYLPNGNGSVPYGVVHHDDLIYLFYISELFPYFDSDYPESKMVDRLTLMWATFAQTGYPVPESNPGIKWEPFRVKGKKYLEIGAKLQVKENLNGERYNLWNKLFPTSWC